jgi:hypothetical protein
MFEFQCNFDQVSDCELCSLACKEGSENALEFAEGILPIHVASREMDEIYKYIETEKNLITEMKTKKNYYLLNMNCIVRGIARMKKKDYTTDER